VKLTLEKLGPFSYDKSDKLITGKEMGPYKFPNDTVYVGQWYVIYYLTRTVNRMEKDSTTFRISRILKALLLKAASKVFYKLNQAMAASSKQTVITTKGS
jgi:hypothetical protein